MKKYTKNNIIKKNNITEEDFDDNIVMELKMMHITALDDEMKNLEQDVKNIENTLDGMKEKLEKLSRIRFNLLFDLVGGVNVGEYFELERKKFQKD